MTQEELIVFTETGKEVWKPVVGYEGYFEISNLGRVKSVDRYVVNTARDSGHQYHVAEKIKKVTINAMGYPCVTLCKDRKSKQIPIHRLLMEAFVPKPEGKNEIDHINTIKTDNSFKNLRWVTHLENMNNDTTLHHFSIDANSEQKKRERLEARKANGGETAPITVFQYTKDGEFVAKYLSTFEAQYATDISCTSIRRALNDNGQTAGGFMWFTSLQDNIKYSRRLPKNTKLILQYDSNNTVVKEWSSLSEISRTLGLNINMVSRSIKQKQPYKGYIFKYKEV